MRRKRLRWGWLYLFSLVVAAILVASALGGCGKGKPTWWNDQSQEGEDGKTRAEGFAGIAYVRGDHIYLADAEEKEVRRLTTRGGGYSCLAFSPDASKLAAIMVEGDADPQLVIIDVESGDMWDVSWTNRSYSGVWNEAGVRPWFGTIAWADEDTLYATAVSEELSRLYPHVVMFDLSSPGVEIVADDAVNPSLSPGGDKLLYMRQPEDWSAVAADSMWLSGDPGDLVIRELESGDEREVRVTVDGVHRGHVFAASFSPDGDHLAVVCYDEPDTAIYYTNLKGETAYALGFVGTAGKIWQSSFSPDGEWLAYHSTWVEDVEGNREYTLHVIPTGRANPEPLTFESKRDPAWSPIPCSGLERKDLEGLLGGRGEEGGADEMDEVEAAMIAFVKANAVPGLEFKIVNLEIRGNEAVGVAVCTNEKLDNLLVIMKKGPRGWEGVDLGTGIEPPSWYRY